MGQSHLVKMPRHKDLLVLLILASTSPSPHVNLELPTSTSRNNRQTLYTAPNRDHSPSVMPVSTSLPEYAFGYTVLDSETGDSKSRQEKRDGDVVTGSYTVADPDGRIRTVTYKDDGSGFVAQVT